MAEHPPIWTNPNKKLVFEIACPPTSVHRGQLAYSRWQEIPLPHAVEVPAAMRRLIARPGYYDYAPLPPPPTAVEWHVNFADPALFALLRELALCSG